MKKIPLLFSCATLALLSPLFGASQSVQSPDGRLTAIVEDGAQLTLTLRSDGHVLVDKMQIGLDTDRGIVGRDAKILEATQISKDEVIDALGDVKSKMRDHYNEMDVQFEGYTLCVRLYNNAYAYRFITKLGKGDMIVNDEIFILDLDDSVPTIAHRIHPGMTAFESLYTRETVKELRGATYESLPFLFEIAAVRVALVQADWHDYPGLRVACTKAGEPLHGQFEKVPKTFNSFPDDFDLKIATRENYIAKTAASRAFPWRAFIIARRDSALAVDDTVYKLSSPNAIGDTSWIKGGNSTWDWWMNWNTEDIDFPVGISNEMYKHYIDFAAEYGVDFVTFDLGWHMNEIESMKTPEGRAKFFSADGFVAEKPFIDIEDLTKYAHSKGVRTMLWSLTKVLFPEPEKTLDFYKSWGIDALKIDYANSDDQDTMQKLEHLLKLCAERKILVVLHGCPPMAGLHRTYPNLMSAEGVKGTEVNKFRKFISPSHDVDLVFTRMLLGPMDYTPGGMRNVTPAAFKSNLNLPEVMGTRAHMMSMYILYLSPIQMMTDAPSYYRKSPDVTKFIATTPTSWDDSRALDGKIGEFVVIARRKGDAWYVGGMNGGQERYYKLNLSKFLNKSATYEAEIFTDGLNANVLATEYKRELRQLKGDEVMEILMKNDGGFVMKLTPAKK